MTPAVAKRIAELRAAMRYSTTDGRKELRRMIDELMASPATLAVESVPEPPAVEEPPPSPDVAEPDEEPPIVEPPQGIPDGRAAGGSLKAGAAHRRKWQGDERVEQIRDLWENHPELSVKKIGARFDVSKNVIIGIAHRNGFRLRGKEKGETPSAIAPMADPFAGIEPHDCRWPIGDPGQPDFHFCGEDADSGRPYCKAHSKIAYVNYTRFAAQSAAWTEEKRAAARQRLITRMRAA